MSTRNVNSPSKPGLVVAVWALVCLQVGQVFYFLVMGLGWGGALYTANVVQGLVLLAAGVLLAARRRLLVLLVPVLSCLISLALQGTDAVLTARACSSEAKAAVDELGLSYVVDDGDPFTYVLDFPDTCSALFGANAPAAEVVENYRRAALKAGWEFTGAQNARHFEASNAQWTVEVEPDREEDGLLELQVRPRRT